MSGNIDFTKHNELRNIDFTEPDDDEDDKVPTSFAYSSLSEDSSDDDDDSSTWPSSLSSSDEEDSLEVTRKKELERDRYKRELYEFYSVHNPAKINLIDNILDTFAGREDKLLKEYLPRKYNKKKKGEEKKWFKDGKVLKPWHRGEWDDIVNVTHWPSRAEGQVAFVGPDGIPGIGTEIKVPRHKRMGCWRKAQEKIRKWNPMKRNRRTRVAPMPQEGGIRKKRRKTRRKKRNRKKSTRRRKRKKKTRKKKTRKYKKRKKRK